MTRRLSILSAVVIVATAGAAQRTFPDAGLVFAASQYEQTIRAFLRPSPTSAMRSAAFVAGDGTVYQLLGIEGEGRAFVFQMRIEKDELERGVAVVNFACVAKEDGDWQVTTFPPCQDGPLGGTGTQARFARIAKELVASKSFTRFNWRELDEALRALASGMRTNSR